MFITNTKKKLKKAMFTIIKIIYKPRFIQVNNRFKIDTKRPDVYSPNWHHRGES